MTSDSGLQKHFGDLEWTVMTVVWEDQPMTVAQVRQQLNNLGEQSWAYTTIMTVLSRLAEKGWLQAEKKGRAYIYSAMYTRQEAEAVLASEAIRTLLEDFGDLAVAQFVKEVDRINPDMLARLAELAEGTDDQ